MFRGMMGHKHRLTETELHTVLLECFPADNKTNIHFKIEANTHKQHVVILNINDSGNDQ